MRKIFTKIIILAVISFMLSLTGVPSYESFADESALVDILDIRTS